MSNSSEWEPLLSESNSGSNSGSDVLTVELTGHDLPVPMSETVPSEVHTDPFATPFRRATGSGDTTGTKNSGGTSGETSGRGSRGSRGSGRDSQPLSLTPPPKQSVPTPQSSGSSMPSYYNHYSRSVYSQSVNTANMFAEPAAVHRESVNLRSLNQVPPHFSQFLDQGSPANTHSRDISQSMGSQATIFSTREDKPKKQRSKSKRAGLDSQPSLRRRDALRFKEGSATYRVRLQLRKLAAKLRGRWTKVRRFFAGRKKATSSVQRRSSRRGRPVISAPVTNPGVGSGGAQRVDELTDQLKAMAGGPGKLSHLSSYIEEQRQLSQPVPSSYSEESAAPPPPPHTDDSFRRRSQRQSPDEIQKLAQIQNQAHGQSQEQSSQAQTHGQPSAQEQSIQTQLVWKQYLSNVLASRIKLRQEIHLFQALLANQNIPGLPFKSGLPLQPGHPMQPGHARNPSSAYSKDGSVRPDLYSHRASIVYSQHTDSTRSPASKPAMSVASKDLSVVEIDADANADVASSVYSDESVDEHVHKLQSVLNRRSMLGEMLDYDSDRDSLASSTSNLSEPSQSDASLEKRYGTVRRRSTLRSSVSQLNDVHTMPRSRGVPSGLHQIAQS